MKYVIKKGSKGFDYRKYKFRGPQGVTTCG